jgi:hypothetical protein
MRLRTRPVAHGGLSPPPTMAADTQRTAMHRAKMVTFITTITDSNDLTRVLGDHPTKAVAIVDRTIIGAIRIDKKTNTHSYN